MKKLIVGFILSAFLSMTGVAAEPAATPESIEKGKQSYATNCLACHGASGDGNGPAGAYMKPKPRDLAKEKFKKGDKPGSVFKVLSEGLAGTSMAGYGHLPVEERWAITHYILTFRNGAKK